MAARFAVGERTFCIPRLAVRGLIEAPVLVPAPRSPPWLIGALNYMGRAVAAVDVGKLVFDAPPKRQPAWVLLVAPQGDLLGLITDRPPEDVRMTRMPTSERLVEVVDTRTTLLWLDLDRLHEHITQELLGSPAGAHR